MTNARQHHLVDDDTTDDLDVRQLSRSEQKVQRWVDLMAALLLRHRHATFDELAKDVPGYDLSAGQRESVMRTFERDKDELRRFGIPFDTARDSENNPLGYRIDRKAFYLPYLLMTGGERAFTATSARTQEGYRALETLTFDPAEIDAVIQASARVSMLGDPVLTGEAEAAIRKLALDLPLGVVAGDTIGGGGGDAASSTVRTVPPRQTPDVVVFERLSDALARRKRVTFEYFTMERGQSTSRTVEPYGLFFVSSHWYLAGRDIEKNAIRNFRLSRITRIAVNGKKSQSADYQIPTDFVLRDHAQSREPWEIGEGDAMSAVVEFTATTGATRAALALGQPMGGNDAQRRFAVRRIDAFARWLLSFGGDARPLEPPELVAEFDRVRLETLALYRRSRDDSSASAGAAQ